jgi:hypothetical protein
MEESGPVAMGPPQVSLRPRFESGRVKSMIPREEMLEGDVKQNPNFGRSTGLANEGRDSDHELSLVSEIEGFANAR